jgi:acyl-coenzyme A synthetase/AMP-(fatty) acid ligase
MCAVNEFRRFLSFAVCYAKVLKRLGTPESLAKTPMVAGRDLWWHEATASQPAACETEWLDAEAPAFILYTSGSTGKPKGIVHTTGGYMLGAATSFKYTFDTQPGDVYFCTADCGANSSPIVPGLDRPLTASACAGWITGHSYVTYGPLFNGASQVVFEGVPSFPTAVRCPACGSCRAAPAANHARDRSRGYGKSWTNFPSATSTRPPRPFVVSWARAMHM